jgi:hypothetical protein
VATRIGGDSGGDGVGPGYPPLVMEFLEGAEEMGDADVDEGIVDEGLSLIRKLWDAGDVLGQFRARAPERRPISNAFLPAQNLGVVSVPECGVSHASILSARAVPSAAAIPCPASLPSWWNGGGVIHSGETSFWLNSDQGGMRAVTLRSRCDVSSAHEVPSDEAGTRRFEGPSRPTPRLVDVRSYIFPGGCTTTYRFAFLPGASPAMVFDVDEAVSFVHRSDLVAHLRKTEGLPLCGRGGPCPP